MGFILLAQGRGGIFIGTELTWNVAYLGAIFLGTQQYGLVMAGVGFWVAYLIYYGVVALVASSLIGFKPSRRNWTATLLLLIAGGLIMVLASQSLSMGYAVGLLATLVAGAYSLRRLESLVNMREWLNKRLQGR
jgi:PST family polysaccharide transporter